MPRLGLGFGSRTRQMPPQATGPGSGTQALVPSASWDGSAGSGFATAPVAPQRTTAAPAVRLLTPPNQVLTDELTVGVMALANNGGSMFDNLGLEKVVAHFEGSSLDVLAPSFHTFADANGSVRTYFGWWITLQRPADHSGDFDDAQLYFEAVPKDPSMQARIIGPYTYLLSRQLHDHEIEVAATPAELPGVRYRTIKAALGYLKSVSAINPRITVSETGTYPLGVSGGPYFGSGRCVIEGSVPFTIGNPAPFSGTSNALSNARTTYDGLHFRGANCTIDLSAMYHIYHEGNGPQHWADGITIHSGVDGRNTMWGGGPREWGAFRNTPYLTECTVDGVLSGGNGAALVRGCHFQNGGFDLWTNATCVVSSTCDNWHTYDQWNVDVPALDVSYSGPEATATLESTGSGSSRTFTARWGANSDSFTVYKSDSYFTAGNNYEVRHVADWIDGLPGWNATVLDNTRRASNLALEQTASTPFAAQDVKNATLQLVTMFDLHGDVWQHLIGGVDENVIVYGNTVTNFGGQCFFISSTTDARDFLFVNNAFHGLEENDPGIAGTYYIRDYFFSQWDRSGDKSHLVFAHNSMSQGWSLDPGNYASDGYCLIANNVARALNVESGSMPSDLIVANNHFFTGVDVSGTSTGTTSGGDDTTLFVDARNGDFTPAGALAGLQAASVLAVDSGMRARLVHDVPGAVAG